MKILGKFLLTVFIVLAVAAFYSKFRHHTAHSVSEPLSLHQDNDDSRADTSESPRFLFHCDGRTYCSQMTSCDEAKYFLAHCPNVRMDGDNDGVPCESQWCPNG